MPIHREVFGQLFVPRCCCVLTMSKVRVSRFFVAMVVAERDHEEKYWFRRKDRFVPVTLMPFLSRSSKIITIMKKTDKAVQAP